MTKRLSCASDMSFFLLLWWDGGTALAATGGPVSSCTSQRKIEKIDLMHIQMVMDTGLRDTPDRPRAVPPRTTAPPVIPVTRDWCTARRSHPAHAFQGPARPTHPVANPA